MYTRLAHLWGTVQPLPPHPCRSPGIGDAYHCTHLYLDERILTQALTLCSEHTASEMSLHPKWHSHFCHLHDELQPMIIKCFILSQVLWPKFCPVIYRLSCQFFWPPCLGSVFYLFRTAGFQYLCLKHNKAGFCWLNQSESPFPEGNTIGIYCYNVSLALVLSLTLVIIFSLVKLTFFLDLIFLVLNFSHSWLYSWLLNPQGSILDSSNYRVYLGRNYDTANHVLTPSCTIVSLFSFFFFWIGSHADLKLKYVAKNHIELLMPLPSVFQILGHRHASPHLIQGLVHARKVF